MPISKFHPVENLHRAKRSVTLALWFACFTLVGVWAQEIPQAFKEKAETLVQLQPKDRKIIMRKKGSPPYYAILPI